MQIWLNANMEAHSFIPKDIGSVITTWLKPCCLRPNLYVYEDDAHLINGSIGLMNHYIAGIFVKKEPDPKASEHSY